MGNSLNLTPEYINGVYFIAVKLRIFKLALFLFLGVIVNITVAWLFAITWDFNDMTQLGAETKLGTDDYWRITLLEKFGVIYVSSNRDDVNIYEGFLEKDLPAEALMPPWVDLKVKPMKGDHPFWEPSRRVVAYGWPLVSLWHEYYHTYYDGQGRTNLKYGGIELEDETFRELVRALPVFPILPAFLINTIFYAAIIWIAWAVPRSIKRSRRKTRGACTNCNYDLRGDFEHGCPECGLGRKAEA